MPVLVPAAFAPRPDVFAGASGAARAEAKPAGEGAQRSGARRGRQPAAGARARGAPALCRHGRPRRACGDAPRATARCARARCGGSIEGGWGGQVPCHARTRRGVGPVLPRRARARRYRLRVCLLRCNLCRGPALSGPRRARPCWPRARPQQGRVARSLRVNLFSAAALSGSCDARNAASAAALGRTSCGKARCIFLPCAVLLARYAAAGSSAAGSSNTGA